MPGVQTLIEIGGYAPRATKRGARSRSAEISQVLHDLERDSEAVSSAWSVLKSSEAMEDTHISIWAPLTVFFAGHVIWACILKHGVHENCGSFRGLDLSQYEIKRIGMPCCVEMSEVLNGLKDVTF